MAGVWFIETDAGTNFYKVKEALALILGILRYLV